MVNKLRGYRTMVGYSQEKMAEILGVTRLTYMSKENSVNAFSLKEKNIIYSTLKEKIPELKFNDVFEVLEE